MNQALEVPFTRWVAAVKRLPVDHRNGIEAEFKTMLEALYRAGYAAAMDRMAKAADSQAPPINIRFEPGSFEIHNEIPADGITVKVQQEPRSVVVERDEQGRVSGARQA